MLDLTVMYNVLICSPLVLPVNGRFQVIGLVRCVVTMSCVHCTALPQLGHRLCPRPPARGLHQHRHVHRLDSRDPLLTRVLSAVTNKLTVRSAHPHLSVHCSVFCFVKIPEVSFSVDIK